MRSRSGVLYPEVESPAAIVWNLHDVKITMAVIFSYRLYLIIFTSLVM